MWANFPPPSCTPQVPKLSTSAHWEEAHLRNGGRSLERGSLLQSAQKCPIAPWGHQLPLLSVTRMTAGPLGRAATSFLKCPQLSLCFHCRFLGSSVEGGKVRCLVSLPGATRLCSCTLPSSEKSFLLPLWKLENQSSGRLHAVGPSSLALAPTVFLVPSPSCRPPRCSATPLGPQVPPRTSSLHCLGFARLLYNMPYRKGQYLCNTPSDKGLEGKTRLISFILGNPGEE